MRIALVTETFPPEVNGVAMTNERLLRGLVERGHELLLIKPKNPLDALNHQPQSFALTTVPGIPVPRYPGLRMGWPLFGALKRRLRAFEPDVVHIATEGPLGLFALRAARTFGCAVTSTFHTNFQDYCKDYGAGFLSQTTLAYLRWFHNQCALTTVPDATLIHRLSAAGFERLELLKRGADTKLFSPERRDPSLRNNWGVPSDQPICLYVGRVAAEKDIPLSIKAWRAFKTKCSDSKMVVVGDGPELRRFKKAHPDVHFTGMKYGEDLAAHYASADLFFFASTSETFGNVILEAMASGLAVVTYDYAAGRQFIENNRNGILVEVGKDEAFCNAATDLATRVKHLTPMRTAARSTAMAHPWSEIIDHFEGLILAAAGGKK